MFSSLNIKLVFLAIGLLIVGYVLLGQGPFDNHLSLSVAPIVLVGVYCALVPFAILAREKEKGKDVTQKTVKQGV